MQNFRKICLFSLQNFAFWMQNLTFFFAKNRGDRTMNYVTLCELILGRNYPSEFLLVLFSISKSLLGKEPYTPSPTFLNRMFLFIFRLILVLHEVEDVYNFPYIITCVAISQNELSCCDLALPC